MPMTGPFQRTETSELFHNYYILNGLMQYDEYKSKVSLFNEENERLIEIFIFPGKRANARSCAYCLLTTCVNLISLMHLLYFYFPNA